MRGPGTLGHSLAEVPPALASTPTLPGVEPQWLTLDRVANLKATRRTRASQAAAQATLSAAMRVRRGLKVRWLVPAQVRPPLRAERAELRLIPLAAAEEEKRVQEAQSVTAREAPRSAAVPRRAVPPPARAPVAPAPLRTERVVCPELF